MKSYIMGVHFVMLPGTHLELSEESLPVKCSVVLIRIIFNPLVNTFAKNSNSSLNSAIKLVCANLILSQAFCKMINYTERKSKELYWKSIMTWKWPNLGPI